MRKLNSHHPRITRAKSIGSATTGGKPCSSTNALVHSCLKAPHAVTLVAGKPCRACVPPCARRPQRTDPQTLNPKEFVRNKFETNSPLRPLHPIDSRPFNEENRHTAPGFSFARSSPRNEPIPGCRDSEPDLPRWRSRRRPSHARAVQPHAAVGGAHLHQRPALAGRGADLHRSADPCIHSHLVHLPGVAKTHRQDVQAIAMKPSGTFCMTQSQHQTPPKPRRSASAIE